MTSENFISSISNDITAGFIVVFLLVALVYRSKCWATIRVYDAQLQAFLKALDEARDAGGSQQSAAQAYFEIEDHKTAFPAFAYMWRQYQRHLVLQDNRRVAAADADEFFYVDTLTAGLSMGIWNNLGSIFTGLGILGTFAGLSVGIFWIDFSNAQSIQSSIQSLLDGTKTAFLTSIVGILFALLYNGLHESCLMGRFAKRISDVVARLDEVFPQYGAQATAEAQTALLTAARGQQETQAALLAAVREQQETQALLLQVVQGQQSVLSKILGENEQQSESLMELREGIGGDMRDALEKMESEMSSAVEQALKASVGGDFKKTVEQLTETIRSLEESGRKAIERELERGARQVTQEFTKELQQMTAELQTMFQGQTAQMSASATALCNMVDQAKNVQQETIALIASLQRTATEAVQGAQATAETMGKATEPVRQATELLAQNNATTVALLEGLQASVEKVAETSQALTKTLASIETFQGQNNIAFEGLRKKLENISLSLEADLADMAKKQGEYMETYDTNVSDAMNGLMGISVRLNDAIEQLGKRQQGGLPR